MYLYSGTWQHDFKEEFQCRKTKTELLPELRLGIIRTVLVFLSTKPVLLFKLVKIFQRMG